MKKSKFRRWTPEEDKLLRELYPRTANSELVKIFDRTHPAKIYRRAVKLGLSKDRGLISERTSKRMKAWYAENPPTGAKNNNWQGGGMTRKRGYVYEYVGYEYPFNNKGYCPQHRFIAEESLDIILEPQMIVHHIDFDKKNNDIENLFIFPSNSEHMSFHMNLRYNNIKQITKTNIWEIKQRLQDGERLAVAVAMGSNVI